MSQELWTYYSIVSCHKNCGYTAAIVSWHVTRTVDILLL